MDANGRTVGGEQLSGSRLETYLLLDLFQEPPPKLGSNGILTPITSNHCVSYIYIYLYLYNPIHIDIHIYIHIYTYLIYTGHPQSWTVVCI